MARSYAGLSALTITLSAFLLFQIQPMIGKALLPRFGGSPSVWTTSMLFFQSLLLAGYAYARWQAGHDRTRLRTAVHLGLVGLALLSLPVAPNAIARGTEHGPQLRLLLALLLSVGLPYFLLSSTGPLVQAWVADVLRDRSPYRLYALSNAGSMLALLSYPVLVEPSLALDVQVNLWSAAFAACALLIAYLAVGRARVTDGTDVAASVAHVPAPFQMAWVALPALASLMLLAVTDHLTQNVAVVPFLWVAPLALYLLSFILCFAEGNYYRPRVYGLLTVGLLLLSASTSMAGYVDAAYAELGLAISLQPLVDSAVFEGLLYLALLFCVCMVSHGEMVKRRPPAHDLTRFYLAMSVGGAVGGLSVGMLAPLLFRSYLELHFGAAASYLLAVHVLLGDDGKHTHAAPIGDGTPPERRSQRTRTFWIAAVVGLSLFGAAAHRESRQHAIYAARNFYGVIAVGEVPPSEGSAGGRALYHGAIVHGYQGKARPHEATTYYHTDSGVGRLLRDFPRAGPLRVGAVGLGIGTIATYARPGDTYRFYEINPLVVDVAQSHFTFLQDSAARVEIATGDARVELEAEPAQGFDLLVVDAFSGDAVPTHLLTKECFAVYLRHLAPGGAMAFNVSNRYLALSPVVLGLARAHGLPARHYASQTDGTFVRPASEWVVVARDPAIFNGPALASGREIPDSQLPVWTDRSSNLLHILR